MNKRVLVALVVALALLATASLVWANGGGLVSYWPFDEGSGPTANDAVNGNDGTIHGATHTTDKAPVIGNDYALEFVGVEFDYVQVANSSTLEPTNVTVAAWVKSSSPGSTRYILGKGGQACSAASYALYTRGGGLYFYVYNPATGYCLSPGAGTGVWDGEWHHVVGTYDGSYVRLYVDGAEMGTGAPTSIAIGYGLTPTDDFFVGAYGGTCDLYFNGLIDEVGIWNRALSADEVAFLASPEVVIDIKPGSDPNCFNSDSHGVIPVAILGSADFDASTVDPFTVSLNGAGVRVKGKSGNAGSLENVNGDGFQDLVVQIIDEGGYTSGDTTAILKGYTYDGLPIVGTDTICIVPPK